MGLLERLHKTDDAPVPAEEHADDHHGAPFWVRHYDLLSGIISFGRTDRIHRATLDLAGFHAGQSLLDVGCGTGELVRLAADRSDNGGTLVGLDIEPLMIEQANTKVAKHRINATFAEASIDSIPYPDHTFDVVVSSLMFHHLTEAQQAAGLAEIARVLAPGGTLLIADINSGRRSLVSSMPGHGSNDQSEPVQVTVARQLEAAGFTSVERGDHKQKALYFARGRTP